jgi:predicted  nucleic acid-binding Zn-ribbon protein
VDLAAGGGPESDGRAGGYGGDPGQHHLHRPLDSTTHRRRALKADPAAQLALLDLQELDSRADQLRHQRETLPELAEIASLTTSRAELDGRRRDAQIGVDDLTAEQAKVDTDVEQVKARRVRDQERMDQGLISSPKDLERMQGELESLQRRITTLEDEELEVMARLEDAQRDLDSLTEQVAASDERLAALGAARDAKTQELDEALRTVAEDRGPAVAAIPADLLALYDRLRASKGGVAVGALRARQCGGCRLALDPSELAAIKAADPDEVIRHEECQRILVRTPESGL